jgi:predicted DNA-binding transcriptional regulator YafY
MPRGEQLTRQWRLLKCLERLRYGATVSQLGADLNVSRRTVQRDLAVLRDAGFPLDNSAEAHGEKRWRVKHESGHLPNVTFSLTEAIALYLGHELLRSMAGTDIATATEGAFRKIRQLLDRTALDYFARLPSFLYVKPRYLHDGTDQSDVLDALMLACEDRKVVRIDYKPPWRRQAFRVEVHPYGLVFHEGGWYLLAFYPPRDAIRHYKVARVSSVDILDGQFERPAGFSPEAHLHDSFGIFQPEKKVRVRIRFHPDLAALATETRWHPSQKTRPQKDGSVIVELVVGHTEELKRWLMGFGADAEVLEPGSLRAEIAGDIGKARALYGRKSRDHVRN